MAHRQVRRAGQHHSHRWHIRYARLRFRGHQFGFPVLVLVGCVHGPSRHDCYNDFRQRRGHYRVNVQQNVAV